MGCAWLQVDLGQLAPVLGPALGSYERCGAVISPSLHRLYAALGQVPSPDAQAEAEQLVAIVAGGSPLTITYLLLVSASVLVRRCCIA